VTQRIINTILVPELEFFNKFSYRNEISKEDLLRKLNIVRVMILGAGSYLPPGKEDEITLRKSQIPQHQFSCIVRTNDRVLTVNGMNARVAVHNAMSHFVSCMNISREDDTKCFFRNNQNI
jgi:hypothetical protein